MVAGDESFEGALRELAAAPPVRRDALLAALELTVGTRIGGRYEIRRRLGAGGMGVVFAVYDLHLDREVALKVHATRPTPDQVERMLREAQAMARVAHPNVATVFDVGMYEGWLWVAMELVDGPNARDWITSQRPAWSELQRLFVRAGRGLAAAHVAGIVHRDFKPGNILVSLDPEGRLHEVKVADFGLALSAGSRVVAPKAGSKRSSQNLTETGTVLGTAAYMAPEQSVGTHVDGRADQYSFCVSLLEACVLQRGGDPAATLRLNDLRDAKDLPPVAVKVLQRGLQADPAQRFASMHELLVVLEATPSRTAAIAGIATAAVAIAGVTWAATSPSNRCALPEESATVWPATRRVAMERRMATAEDVDTDAMIDSVDSYVQRWSRAWVQACEDPETDGALLDQRTRCLRDRISSLDATLTAFESLGASKIGRAVRVLPKAESLDACIDPAQLSKPVPLPDDPIAAAKVERVLSSLRQWPALEAAGAFVDAERQYARAVTDANMLAHPQLIARARFVHGSTLASLGRFDEARVEFESAFETAQSCGYGHIAYQTATTLVDLVGTRLHDREQAWVWLRHAESLSSRAAPTPDSRMHLLRVQAELLEEEDRLDEALVATDAALAVAEELEDGRMYRGGLLTDKAGLLRQLGRHAEALSAAEAAKSAIVGKLGEEHPMVAIADTTLAKTLEGVGRESEAEAPLRNALRIVEATLGPTNSQTGLVHIMLGEHLSSRGKPAQALASFKKAVEILEGGGDATVHQVGSAQTAIGEASLAIGDPAAAVEAFRRALVIHETNPEAEASARVDLAAALFELGDHAEANALLSRAEVQARDRDDDATTERIKALRSERDATP